MSFKWDNVTLGISQTDVKPANQGPQLKILHEVATEYY